MNSHKQVHIPCPCGQSTDAYCVNEKGWGKCFSCGKKFPPKDEGENNIIPQTATTPEPVRKEFKPHPEEFKPFRGYSAASSRKFLIDVYTEDESDVLARYPIFSNGHHIGNKVRCKDKKFYVEGDTKNKPLDLGGQHAFPAGCAKTVTVVEGQDDAPAAFEMMGSKYPVVYVHSAGSALQDCKINYEYLDSFDEIVFCFDKDEAKINPQTGDKYYPGQEAARACAMLFKPGKVRIVTFDLYKDSNDYLLAGKQAQFYKEWWKGPVFMPDGLRFGPDLLNDIVNRPSAFTVPFPIEALNKFTYGIRLSEAIIITADTGVGKTSIVKKIEYSLLMNEELKEKNYGVGFLHFEEPIGDTGLGLLSIHNSKPYHLPDVERTEQELRDAYDAVLNTNRVVMWDHFGSNSVEAVLSKVRHMHALGCKYIVIDHLSIIVSDQSGDERKQLDEISTKLKTLCMELNIALIAVVHTNRQGEIRGSSGPEKLANTIMKLERDVRAFDPWRRNVTKITIEKNRFAGRTGPCAWLWYNDATGQIEELNSEEIDIYENGGTIRDIQRAF